MGSPPTDVPKSTPGHGGKREGAGRKPTTGSGRGGARPGSGPKPKAEQNDAYTVLAKAKAKHETYKAQLAELDYKERAGQLIEAARVGEIWRKHIETAKGRLLAIPSAHAQAVFRAASVAEVEQQLRDALMAVMEEIADAGLDAG